MFLSPFRSPPTRNPLKAGTAANVHVHWYHPRPFLSSSPDLTKLATHRIGYSTTRAADPNTGQPYMAPAQQYYDPSQYYGAYQGYAQPQQQPYGGMRAPSQGGRQGSFSRTNNTFHFPSNASLFWLTTNQPRTGGPRTRGMGIAGLPQAIQDLLNQCFLSGSVSTADVPDSIYDSLSDFDGCPEHRSCLQSIFP